MKKKMIGGCLLLALMTSCTTKKSDEGSERVSVSMPAVAYFVDRLTDKEVDVNVMVEQSTGHSTYTPRPAQMVDLAESKAFLAIGPLDFELAWKDRMLSSAPQMTWYDLSHGIDLIEEHHHDEHAGADPHYWLSPKQVAPMLSNLAESLRSLFPDKTQTVDSALQATLADVRSIDSELDSLAARSDKAFMIYHPALSYLARDYGLRQFEVEKDGNAATPQTYMRQIDEARAAGARVVFIQQGAGNDKVEQAAKALDARTVELSPEQYDWLDIMHTIVNALKE